MWFSLRSGTFPANVTSTNSMPLSYSAQMEPWFLSSIHRYIIWTSHDWMLKFCQYWSGPILQLCPHIFQPMRHIAFSWICIVEYSWKGHACHWFKNIWAESLDWSIDKAFNSIVLVCSNVYDLFCYCRNRLCAIAILLSRIRIQETRNFYTSGHFWTNILWLLCACEGRVARCTESVCENCRASSRHQHAAQVWSVPAQDRRNWWGPKNGTHVRCNQRTARIVPTIWPQPSTSQVGWILSCN